MPAYDYRCTACATTFEVVCKAGERTDKACPSCGSATKRVFTPVGVHFKGSGFHNTDYRPKHAEEKPPVDAPAKPAPCGADAPASTGCASCPAATE